MILEYGIFDVAKESCEDVIEFGQESTAKIQTLTNYGKAEFNKNELADVDLSSTNLFPLGKMLRREIHSENYDIEDSDELIIESLFFHKKTVIVHFILIREQEIIP
jgi:hypothetical protein